VFQDIEAEASLDCSKKGAESKCLTTEDTEFPNKDAYRAIIALAVCVLESFYERSTSNASATN
jgi:hypothetical protein